MDDSFDAYVNNFKRITRLDPSVRTIQKWWRNARRQQYLKYLANVSITIDRNRKQRHYQSLCQFSRISLFNKRLTLLRFYSGWRRFTPQTTCSSNHPKATS
ncbi:hypothetical protein GEMRC1_008416 [Eukaryota sp. GEM-RC1]